MTTFPNSPKIFKGGIVLIDAKSGKTLNMIAMQIAMRKTHNK